MTLFEEKRSNDNKNWTSFDNFRKTTRISKGALVPREQFSGFRKSKSELELSKCTCSMDMGSKMSRPQSFHDFEMLEDQIVAKKRSLPDTSDFSDDDYLPLDSTEDEIQTEDEVNDSTFREQNSQVAVDYQSIGNIRTDESEVVGSSVNGNCSSFNETSSEIQSNPRNESTENVVGRSEALKNDSYLKCMTLPKTRSVSSFSHLQRSLRQTPNAKSERSKVSDASDNVSLLPKIGGNSSGHELRRSLKKIKPCEPLPNEPPISENTVVPTCPPLEAVESCPSDPDVFIVLLTEQQMLADSSRPRQYGRRSNPVRISSFAIESSDNGAARIIAHHNQQQLPRPISAPVQRLIVPENISQRRRECLPSEVSSLDSSRNSSPVSIASSSDSSLVDPIVSSPRIGFVSSTRSDEETEAEATPSGSKEFWPHSLSRPICSVFCSLGVFNLSRCAIFTVYFGANYLVQFLILSFVFGIPLLWLQMCLGHKIKGGIVTLFNITPICKGVGIALMISHCIITLYSSVSIGWLIIYIRDSFVSNGHNYRWEERFQSFRGYQNGTASTELSENIADYWNFVVLQRHSNLHEGNQMKFQLAFNVSIVWVLVFAVLCRGIRSLGQIIIGMAILSFLGLFVVCIKFLTLLSFETIQDIFPATDWQDFFANSNSWSVAAQESFLTWGLLGVSVYGMYCNSDRKTDQPFVLRREAFLIVFLTFFGLFLGAVLGSTCVTLLKLNGFNYYPASFENPKNDIFLWPAHQAVPLSGYQAIPSKSISRFSNVIGESFEKLSKVHGIYVVKETGFKPIRLVTEILPATLAISSEIEPAWGVIAFVSLFLLGLAQLVVMWKPIAGAIGKNTSAILLSCITGLFLGFPLTTDNGIVIAHYLDYIFGGSWFLLVLWTFFIIAIFLIRGSPYTSDVLAKELRFNETFSVFLAFSWNVLVPLALILLSVIEYRKSHSRELFNHKSSSSDHLTSWPSWAKYMGGISQIGILLIVPFVSIVQIYVYLSKGPRDILERIELLFRPRMDPPLLHAPVRRLYPQTSNQSVPAVLPVESSTDVPPPKYSPPPSYGHAVGARIAKVLRNSIRSSVRRFRRSDDIRADVEGPSFNIPSISSRVQDSSVNSVNDFIRSRIHRQNDRTQSVENLLMCDLTLNNECRSQNEVSLQS